MNLDSPLHLFRACCRSLPASGFAVVLFAVCLLLSGCAEEREPPNADAEARGLAKQRRFREREERQAAVADEQRREARERFAFYTAMRHGAAWLLNQQDEDGAWRSETYGSMKGGASLTALSLYAVSHLGQGRRGEERRAAAQRGLAFLQQGIEKKGFVACPDGTLDFPVYSTALTLIAARRTGLKLPEAQRESMVEFLIAEQCAEQRGFVPNQPDYGGWDLAGGAGLKGESTGTNISVTRLAVDALLDESNVAAQSAVLKAISWSFGVQSAQDGGFFFHPLKDHEGNKALWADGDAREQPRSYGTATCDGFLLLEATGEDTEAPRRLLAIEWLLKHPAVDRVPGFEDAPPELGWEEGLHFYYLMVLAQSLRHLPEDMRASRRTAIAEQLLTRQQPDGSWQNPSARMREDDPIIATCFALVALGSL